MAVTSSAIQAGTAPVKTFAQGMLNAWPEKSTFPVGIPVMLSETVLWPAVTVKVLLAVRLAELAISWMHTTPPGALKTAAMWASDDCSAGFSALLQAHRTAARPEAMVRRFDIV